MAQRDKDVAKGEIMKPKTTSLVFFFFFFKKAKSSTTQNPHLGRNWPEWPK